MTIIIEDLAQEIRRVDGNNSLGSVALAEALRPFIERYAAGRGGAVPAWFGQLPAYITNPESWPENYVDGYNDALRLCYEVIGCNLPQQPASEGAIKSSCSNFSNNCVDTSGPAAVKQSLTTQGEALFGDGPIGLTECPITGRKFFTNVEHPKLGMVATYGGPFDSYTIPEICEDDELRCERYDWDADHWVEGGEPVGYFYKDQQKPSDAEGEGGEAMAWMYEYRHDGMARCDISPTRLLSQWVIAKQAKETALAPVTRPSPVVDVEAEYGRIYAEVIKVCADHPMAHEIARRLTGGQADA